MASEGFDVDEEWDPDFVDKLVQAEEMALLSQVTQQNNHLPPPPPSVSYSPPRELSQRTHQTSCITDSFSTRRTQTANESEIDRLKKELNRVSKQLNHLEKECLVLRKERDEKEEQLKVIHPGVKAKDAEFHPIKDTEMDGLAFSPSARGVSAMCEKENPSNNHLGSWTKSCSKGKIQRDKTNEVSTSENASWHAEKLFGLWNSDDQKHGNFLFKNLFKTCETDFQVLSSYLSSPEDNSCTGLSDQQCPQLMETAKVVHLFSVFAKISTDTLRLEDLLEALVDICNLKNVFIVHWSLRVLHKILSHSFSMEKESGKRENVTVEDYFSENTKSNPNGCRGNLANEKTHSPNVAEMLKQGQVPCVLKLSNLKTPGFFDHIGGSVSGVYLVSLFERICLIASANNEHHIRVEALSIMNLILMRHNAYLERDKFVGELAFQSLSQFVRKEAGFSVQEQAVHALYLLCNCPQVIVTISSCLKEDGELASCKDINDRSIPTPKGLNEMLIGLADCVASCGSDTPEEMKLRRIAIVFLAFLGSSGKSGFEILINYRLPKGNNFLSIILQSIISDLDLQALKSANKSSVVREQSLLIREALILLNRLVSHPQYSVPVLQSLTATRDMASMSVDVANRLTQKRKLLWLDDNTAKQIRGSEIVDLALVFKRRVFTFLGDNIS